MLQSFVRISSDTSRIKETLVSVLPIQELYVIETNCEIDLYKLCELGVLNIQILIIININPQLYIT